MSNSKIPLRKDVPAKDKWDLSSIYKSDEEWEADLALLPSLTQNVLKFKGKLAQSSQTLLDALKAWEQAQLKLETVYHYASLQHHADEDDSTATDKEGRAMMAYTKMSSETSFFNPEIQSIDENKIKEWILLPEFADYKIFLEKILHFKPYVLSEKEERLLSLQMQSASTAETAFSVLTNVDMNKTFGSINMDNEEMPLTQSTWSVFMANQDRTVREKAYKQFYKKFEENQNVIAALYAGSVNQDVFYVQAHNQQQDD